MARTRTGSMSRWRNSTWRALVSLRSGCPAGRNRSSPHQMSSRRQSTASRGGAAASSAKTAVPIPPPVSTSDALPAAAWTSTSPVTSMAPAALAGRPAPWGTSTPGVLTPGQARRGARGARPARLALGCARAVQGTPPVGLTGAAQLRDPAVGPGDRDLAVVGGEADLGDARAGRDLAEDLGLQPGRQPDGYKVGARVALLGADHTALDRAVRLIEDRGEQRPPGRRPRPA